MTSSVVATFVQVIQRDTSCPANKARVNLFVQRLLNLRPTLVTKDPTEVYSIGGRALDGLASTGTSAFSRERSFLLSWSISLDIASRR